MIMLEDRTARCILLALILCTLWFSPFSYSAINGVKVIVENRAPGNGTWQTPFWAGFHNGSFDVYTQGVAASFES